MNVRAREKCFVDGTRRKRGEVFAYPEGSEVPAFLEVIEQPKEPVNGLAKKPGLKPKASAASASKGISNLE